MIVLMEVTIIYITLVLTGLIMGSFAGATVWRLRARELSEDKAHHEDYDKVEYKQLSKLLTTKLSKDRSQCLHCSYQLRWHDLIPLVSWAMLRGKCRHCHKPIGYFEPLIELGVALFFVASYIFWPYTFDSWLVIARFIVWLIAGVGLAILATYDTKWFMLPDKVNFTVIALALASATLAIFGSGNYGDSLINIAMSVAILSGLYYVIYLISKGQWIGFGDIKLGLGLALLLSDWQLAFVALFAANLIGCLIVVPMMLFGKLKRDAHIPFGPLLIIGTLIAQLAGPALVSWYVGVLL